MPTTLSPRGTGGGGTADVQFVQSVPSAVDTKKGGIYVAEQGGAAWFRRDYLIPIAHTIDSDTYVRDEVPIFLGSAATSSAPSTSPAPTAAAVPAITASVDVLLAGDPDGKGIRVTIVAAGGLGSAGNNWRFERKVDTVPGTRSGSSFNNGITALQVWAGVAGSTVLSQVKARIDLFSGTREVDTAYIGGADGTEVITAANWPVETIAFTGGVDAVAAVLSPAAPVAAIPATTDLVLVGESGKGLRVTFDSGGVDAGNSATIVLTARTTGASSVNGGVSGTTYAIESSIDGTVVLANVKSTLDSFASLTAAYIGGANGTEAITPPNWPVGTIQFSGGVDGTPAGKIFYYDITTGRIRDADFGDAAWADATNQLLLPLFLEADGSTHNLAFINPANASHGSEYATAIAAFEAYGTFPDPITDTYAFYNTTSDVLEELDFDSYVPAHDDPSVSILAVGMHNLGPLQNTFGDGTTVTTAPDYTADQAAAEVLRDAYATANAAWLALYTGDRSFYIRLIWDGNSVVFQRRNAAGTGWEDVTQVVSGPPGADGTGRQIATALDTFIGNAYWRGQLSGSDLVDAVDTAVGSDIWRTSHTALRNAQAVADLLDTHFLGTSWRTGGTSFTAADATDAAGALLDTTSFFSYDSGTNTLTLAVPDDYITPDMLVADSTAQKAEMRTRIAAAGTDAATTTDAGLQSASDKTKLDGIETGATADQAGTDIASALNTFIGNADWRSRLSGSDLVDAIDLAVGSTIWRTSHTALRNAQAVADLLDTHFLGTSWRMGGGGGTGYTDANATDAAGALLNSVSFFSYDSSTNVLTLAVPDDYITSAMLDSDTTDEKIAFRTKIDAEQSGAVRPDGTVAFTAAIAGVAPTANAHLAIKTYVDSADGLKAALAGATFTGTTGGIAPVGSTDFVTKAYADANYGGSTPVQSHDLWVGWSTDNTVTETEVLAGVSSDSAIATLPTGSGNQFLWVWRSTVDGGDPSEVYIAGGLNQRNTFVAAVALIVSGVAGQIIVSVTSQNVGLLGGENVRVV